MGSNHNTYQHQPLDHTKRTIRVLQIQRGTRNAIHCTLKHIDLRDDQHVCLSYMWGAPDPTYTIYINSRPFRIRGGLNSFLTHAKRLKVKDWLRIDAICINQMNDDEKNHQVHLMADIYRSAKHVLIYPGEFSGIIGVASQIECLNQRKSFPLRDDERVYSLHDLYRFLPRSSRLEHFLNLPYWSRIWIIQEIFVAKEKFVISKVGLLRWEFVVSFVQGMRLGARHHLKRHGKRHANWRASGSFTNFLDNLQMGPEGIFELLGVFRESACADPRDSIYGLLGLIPVPDDFQVNYAVSLPVLALNVLRAFGSGARPEDLFNYIKTINESMHVHIAPVCTDCHPIPGTGIKHESTQLWQGFEGLRACYPAHENVEFVLLAEDLAAGLCTANESAKSHKEAGLLSIDDVCNLPPAQLYGSRCQRCSKVLFDERLIGDLNFDLLADNALGVRFSNVWRLFYP